MGEYIPMKIKIKAQNNHFNSKLSHGLTIYAIVKSLESFNFEFCLELESWMYIYIYNL